MGLFIKPFLPSSLNEVAMFPTSHEFESLSNQGLCPLIFLFKFLINNLHCCTVLHVVSVSSFLYRAACCFSLFIVVPCCMLFQSLHFCTVLHVVSVSSFLYRAACCFSLFIVVPCCMLFQSLHCCTVLHVVLVSSLLYRAACCFSLFIVVPCCM